MSIRFKIAPETSLRGLRPEISIAFGIVQSEAYYHAEVVGLAADAIVYVSSGTNGVHGRKSLHYVGLAFDVDVPGYEDTDYWRALAAGLHEALGPEFDVIDEGSHIHIEFQPKRGMIWNN